MKSIISPLPLCDPGEDPTKLEFYDFLEENVFTTHRMSQNSSEKTKMTLATKMELSMPESAHPNKLPIWSVKSMTVSDLDSKKRTLDTMSSETSDQGLILNDKDYKPFWTESTKTWSHMLWSCTETDLSDSELSYWNICSKQKESNSWFTARAQVTKESLIYPQISSQSRHSLSQVIMDAEQRRTDANEKLENAKKKRKKARTRAKKEHGLMRTRKVRVYPNTEAKETMSQWFGTCRKLVNINIAFMRQYEQNDPEALNVVSKHMKAHAYGWVDKNTGFCHKIDKHGNGVIKAKSELSALNRVFRDKVLAFKNYRHHDWVEKTTPQYMYDNAIVGIVDSKNSNDALRVEDKAQGRKKQGKRKFKFKTKKGQQCITINARSYTGCKKFKRVLSMCKTYREKLPDIVSSAVKLIMDQRHRYFVCIPREIERKSENQAPTIGYHGVAALDPGVRTFQTIYDPDGQVVHWGGDKDMSGRIMSVAKEADKLASKLGTMKRKRTSNGKRSSKTSVKRAFMKKLLRIRQLVDECHRKLALFLCENYRVVLIPEFKTSDMVKKGIGRTISSKTVRSMLTWSHYRFRQHLINVSELCPWNKVIVVNEACSTITCGQCGACRTSFSGKTFTCPDCKHSSDRDVNGARNILLRYLTKFCI